MTILVWYHCITAKKNDADECELLFWHFPCSNKASQTEAAKAGGERVDGHQEGDTVPCQIYDMNETNGSTKKMKWLGCDLWQTTVKSVPTFMNGKTAAELIKREKKEKEQTFFFPPFFNLPSKNN